MASYKYDHILKVHTGLSEKDLKDLYFEALEKQRIRSSSTLNKTSKNNAEDFSEAEFLLRITADLIEADVSIPGFLKHWIKEILDTIACGEDPRVIAFTTASGQKGHRQSHDDEFRIHGTTKNYRIAAIVQLLQLASVKKAEAVRIVTAAILNPLASEQAVRRAIEDWANLQFSGTKNAAYLRSIAKGDGEKESDEFAKVVQHVRSLDLHPALEILLGY